LIFEGEYTLEWVCGEKNIAKGYELRIPALSPAYPQGQSQAGAGFSTTYPQYPQAYYYYEPSIYFVCKEGF
jgi:hypothetical protein